MGPDDCFLFSKVNRWLKGARFFSNEEAKFGTEVYFEVLEKSYVKVVKGVPMLEEDRKKQLLLKEITLKNK